MKKSFILASFLFITNDLFAGGCSGYTLTPSSKTVYGPSADWCNTDGSASDQHWGCPTPYVNQWFYEEYYNNGGNNCGGTRQYYTPVSSCTGDTTKNADNVCVPNSCTASGGSFNYAYGCVLPPLSAYNNNATACHDHDGLLKASGECVSYSDFGAYLLSEPTAMLGAGLFINGYFYTAAGLVGGGLVAAGGGGMAAAGFATIGGLAMFTGVGMALYGASDDIAANFTESPSNDMMAAEKRVKVNLDQYQNTTIATADTTTGQVKEISYIPAVVKQRILEGVVNPTTGLPNVTASQTAGTTSTKYDYSTNTATTQTVKSDGTVQTSTAPFTPLTNPDGTVTAQSHNESIAPTVTGTKSTPIDVPNWNQYQTIAQWTETADTVGGTGGTGTTGGGTGTTPAATGDATADALLNADMPSYSFAETGDFTHTDESHITGMSDNVQDFIDNVSSQLQSVKTVYDETESMLNQGITAPNIPTGQCSNGLQLDIWGKHIDLCPAITEFITPYSNLVALLITLAGLALAISIFLGGM